MTVPKKQIPLTSFDALSGLAQELDAPLQSLAKSSQKLLDEYGARDFEYFSFKDFKNIFSALAQINRQLKRCCVTTGRLLSLNQDKGYLSSPSCQVNGMIKEVVGLLAQQMKFARVKLSARLGSNLPLAMIGNIECHQVIHNVLINAIQSMPAGGKIKLRTAIAKNNKLIVVNVEDEGVGIAPEHLPKVFEPFFTTKERGVEKNSGLGLSIVYSVVRRVGGDVRIQSSLRKGTTVRLELPMFSSPS